MTFKKGNVPWNKGKKRPEISGKNHPMYGKHHSKKTLEKIRKSGTLFLKGQIPWNKGLTKKSSKTVRKIAKKHSKTMKKLYFTDKIRVWNKGLKGIHLNPKTEFKKGQHPSPSTEFKKGQKPIHGFKKGHIPLSPFQKGEKHLFWKEGISNEPYSFDFRNELKEQIRKRDNYTCQECGNKSNSKKLNVHHIDYNKKNSNPNNLVTLCSRCNSKANFNREDWMEHFQNKLNGDCFD